MEDSEIVHLMSAANLKTGEKVFDLFEYDGQKIQPENNPCFDPNKNTHLSTIQMIPLPILLMI